MNTPLRVLVVEDAETDYLLCLRCLRKEGLAVEARRVDTGVAFREALAEGGWDAIISDYSIPGMAFRQIVTEALELAPDLPLILFSGRIGEEEAIALLDLGVRDFVLKDRPGRLPAALLHGLEDAQGRIARRAAQDALAASVAMFQATFEQAAVGIAQLGLDGRVIRVNQRLCEILGYPKEELLRMSSRELSPPEWSDRTWERIARLCAGEGSTFTEEKPNLRRDGSTVWVSLSISLVRDAQDAPEYLVAVVEDLQRRRDAEQARVDSEALLRSVMDSMAQAVVVLDPGGRILHANQAWAAFGRACGAGAGTPKLGQDYFAAMDLSMQPAEAAQALVGMQEVLQGRLARFDLDYTCRPPCEDRWFHLGVTPLVGQQGGLVLIQAEITEQRRADAELRRSQERQLQMERELGHLQRLESVGRLAGGVSHDMNNVLAAIMAMASAQQIRFGQVPGLAEGVEAILDAAGRGRDLVRGLTDFARKDTLRAIPLDLNALVRREADLLERTTFKKVGIQVELQEPLPEILGEPSAFANLLMNLCVNACDAMPAGGTLRLGTGRLADGRVELSVQDTGEGMPPEVAARAMEPFFTTKPPGKGTGLGLSIVYGTAKAYGGTVELQTSPGQGTRVALAFLPAGPGTAPAKAEAPAPAGAARPCTVLLVDDDELIRQTVPFLLETLGHRVEVAAGGQEALARLETGLAPDWVILDLNMPDMGGLETLERLRALRPGLPVLVSTGYRDPLAIEAIQRHKGVGILDKPFLLKDFQIALSRPGT